MTPAIDGLLPEDFKSPMAEARSSASRSRKTTSAGIVWGDETS
jgi:hypothetical protein